MAHSQRLVAEVKGVTEEGKASPSLCRYFFGTLGGGARETRSALRAFEVSDTSVIVRQLLHNIKCEHASPHSKWALCDGFFAGSVGKA